MNIPRFSIIIPVYNVEKYLNKQIDSILNQGFIDFEVILVDDGSPDSSGAICDAYAAKDSRVKVFHKENSGAGDARNLGLKNAIGELVWVIDADDEISENALEKINQTFLEHPDTDVLVLAAKNIDKNGIKRRHCSVFLDTKDGVIKDGDKYIDKLLTRINLPPWNKCAKRDFLIENDIYFKNTKVFNDVYFSLLLLCLAKKIYYIDEYLYVYNTFNETAITRTSTRYALCIIEQLKEVQFRLLSLNLYDKYKIDLGLCFSAHIFMHYARANPSGRNELLKEFKKLLPLYWYLRLRLKIYYYRFRKKL